MHPQHFDSAAATVYGNSLYGPVSGYDASSIKFQHSGYIPAAPDSSTVDASTCYSNYISSHNLHQSLQGYGMRDPPGYSDTPSFFHPGIVPNFGSPSPTSSYYSNNNSNNIDKIGHRISDSGVGEYQNNHNNNNNNIVHSISTKSPDSFLLKPPDPTVSCVSPHEYNNSSTNNNNNNGGSSNNETICSQNCNNNNSNNSSSITNNMLDHQHHLHNHAHTNNLYNPHHHHLQALSSAFHHDHHQHLNHHLPITNLYNDENIHNNTIEPPSKLINHDISFFNNHNNNNNNSNSEQKMDPLVKMEPLSTSEHNNETTNSTKSLTQYHNHNNNMTTPCNNALGMSETASVKSTQDHNISEKEMAISSSSSSSLSSSSSSTSLLSSSSSLTSSAQNQTNSESVHTTNSKESNKAADEKCESAATDTSGSINDKKEDGDGKPTMSYIALIAKAILESDQRRLNLGAIYGWIEKHYPFYKTKGQGWRNSVRHNLSLNDCFIKAGRCEDGKGNYWAIHPANIQDFIRGDFRQRRRSRRRGRKKECDLGMYHVANGYLQPGGTPLASQMALNPTTLSSLYSPYTEAERRAYRLDEALLRQSMNNPFVKWYQHGVSNPAAASPTCSPAGVYPNGTGGSMQWPQGYPDTSTQSMYPTAAINSSFSRQYPPAPVL